MDTAELEKQLADTEIEISQREKAALNQDDMVEIRALRQRKLDLGDQLLITEHVEAANEKEALKQKVKDTQKEAMQTYQRLGKLAQEALPKLLELKPLLAEIGMSLPRLFNATQNLSSAHQEFCQLYAEGLESRSFAIELGLIDNYEALLGRITSKLERMSRLGQTGKKGGKAGVTNSAMKQ